jgi:hypothetical protein
MYAVVIPSGASADEIIVENGANYTTDNDGFIFYRSVTSSKASAGHRTAGISDFSTTGGMSTSAASLLKVTYDKTLSTNEVAIELNLATGGTRVNNINNVGAFGNQTSFIGSRNAGAPFFNGDIAAIILFNRNLTFSEHARVEHYLDRKYALLWSGAPT